VSHSGRRPAIALPLLALCAVVLLCACKASNNNSGRAATAATATRPASVPPATPPPPPPTAVLSDTVIAQVGTPGQVVLSASGAKPDTVTVQAGRTVTFVNADSVPHHPVSVEAGLFDAGTIAPGGSAQVTVTAAGLHDWHDANNPRLSGTIRVIP